MSALAVALDLPESEYQWVTDEKGYVSAEVRDAFFRRLRQKLDNRCCFDCLQRNPVWVSVSHGVFLCLTCSGAHRNMGVHISFVRSVEMDKFYPEQLIMMEAGGNFRAREFFKAQGMGQGSSHGKKVDYYSKAAARHRQQLEKDTISAMRRMKITATGPLALALGVERKDSHLEEEVLGSPHARVSPKASSPILQSLGVPSPKGGASPLVAGPFVLPAGVKPQSNNVIVVKKRPNENSVAKPLATAGGSSIFGDPSRQSAAAAATKPRGGVTLYSSSANGAPALAKGKADSWDFDFDDIEKQEVKATKSKVAPATKKPDLARPSASVTTNDADKSNHKDQVADGTTTDEKVSSISRYAQSQSISSTDLFGDGDQAVRKPSIEKIPGSLLENVGIQHDSEAYQ